MFPGNGEPGLQGSAAAGAIALINLLATSEDSLALRSSVGKGCHEQLCRELLVHCGLHSNGRGILASRDEGQTSRSFWKVRRLQLSVSNFGQL